MKKTIIFENRIKMRLDKFLKEGVFLNWKMTRGEIIRQIKNENILVNGKKTKPSHPLREDDLIEINVEEKPSGLLANEKVEFETIFQDENILVINKPIGLQVHPDFRHQKDTLVNGLLFRFPEIENVGDAPEVRPGIVHRLDKATSGVLIVAKNQKTFLALKEKFKKREMEKKYWAVVYGSPKKKGLIDAPLASSADYKKQIVANEKTRTKIRTAVTEYETLKKNDECTLLEVSPKTGRTHQIRVHLSHIGHPIVGDEKYTKKEMSFGHDAKRLLLHAKSLSFEMDGKRYAFEASLPDDFLEFLEKKKLFPKGLTKSA